MINVVTKFMLSRYDPSIPVLLGLSGGPDSLALLHILLRFKTQYPLKLGIAHVDHRWRPESSNEADQLQKMAFQLGLPFHLKVLNPENLSGNLELACRQERIRFFGELLHQYGYQAVILAHHADDQAETILKRVLEGAPLPALRGIESEAVVEGFPIWRPMLSIQKKKIEEWLNDLGVKGFDDYTNFDPRFLRGRMRSHIIPHLSDQFGKEVSASLCRIGKEADELHEYLNKRLNIYLEQIKSGVHGIYLDLSNQQPDMTLEIKFLVREVCRRAQFILPHSLVKETCRFVQSRVANRSVAAGKHIVYIDRGHIFVIKRGWNVPVQPVSVRVGTSSYGRWNVIAQRTNEVPSEPCHGWKEAWNGQVEAFVPEGEYILGAPMAGVRYPGNSTLTKWWCDHKVPAFMRTMLPVLWQGDRICHEFLSGRTHKKNEGQTNWLHIRLLI